jgi:hypothetical protein
MREFERAVGETALVVRCDASLSTQAEWLLRTVGKVLEATPFREGMTIQMGWTRFSLRTQAGRVVVCEPAFHGNPFVASSVDVTMSLAILSAHDELIQLLGIEPDPVSFHHSVLIGRGCLSERRVFMERRHGTEGDDSGWCVEQVGRPTPTESTDAAEWIRATELLRVRRALVVPLILPAGFRVTWDGEAITSVESPSREDRWSARAAEALRGAEERLDSAWGQASGNTPPS